LLLLLGLLVVLLVVEVGLALALRSVLAWQHEASRRPVAEALELRAVVVALLSGREARPQQVVLAAVALAAPPAEDLGLGQDLLLAPAARVRVLTPSVGRLLRGRARRRLPVRRMPDVASQLLSRSRQRHSSSAGFALETEAPPWGAAYCPRTPAGKKHACWRRQRMPCTRGQSQQTSQRRGALATPSGPRGGGGEASLVGGGCLPCVGVLGGGEEMTLLSLVCGAGQGLSAASMPGGTFTLPCPGRVLCVYVCVCDAVLNAWAYTTHGFLSKEFLRPASRLSLPTTHTQLLPHRQHERPDKDKTPAATPTQHLRYPSPIPPPFAADLLSLRHPSRPSMFPEPSTMLPPPHDHSNHHHHTYDEP